LVVVAAVAGLVVVAPGLVVVVDDFTVPVLTGGPGVSVKATVAELPIDPVASTV
jgi:hypothetical protein